MGARRGRFWSGCGRVEWGLRRLVGLWRWCASSGRRRAGVWGVVDWASEGDWRHRPGTRHRVVRGDAIGRAMCAANARSAHVYFARALALEHARSASRTWVPHRTWPLVHRGSHRIAPHPSTQGPSTRSRSSPVASCAHLQHRREDTAISSFTPRRLHPTATTSTWQALSRRIPEAHLARQLLVTMYACRSVSSAPSYTPKIPSPLSAPPAV